MANCFRHLREYPELRAEIKKGAKELMESIPELTLEEAYLRQASMLLNESITDRDTVNQSVYDLYVKTAAGKKAVKNESKKQDKQTKVSAGSDKDNSLEDSAENEAKTLATEPEKQNKQPAIHNQVQDSKAGVDTVEVAEKAQQSQENTRQTIRDLGEKIGGARKDTSIKTGKTKRTKKAKDDRPAWSRRFEVNQIVKSTKPDEEGKWSLSDSKKTDRYGNPRTIKLFDSEKEALEAIPLVAVSLKHRVRIGQKNEKGEYSYEIWRNVNNRKSVKVVPQSFASEADAKKYMVTHAKEIIETNTTFGEADLPVPESLKRKGESYRAGNAKDTDFKDTYGFRGVEFGNWNNQDDRQNFLNMAFDGLMDLANVLNIPPEALSLNGDLALAFGARGQGLSSAKAHYERNKSVINLTKEHGAGSLAHEWLHSLDHYFGRQDGKTKSEWKIDDKDGTRYFETNRNPEKDFVSSGFGYQSKVRPELKEAFKNVIDTIFYKAETYVEDTQMADKFVASAKDDLAERLDSLRKDLSEQKDPKYWKRNNKPATAEQLIEFDSIAKQLLNGEFLETEWKTFENKNKRSRFSVKSRWTNEALEKLSEIYKSVRGRTGFDSTNHKGTLDYLRMSMKRYDQRLKMLSEAQQATPKERKTLTEFAMDAKELDQGRGSNYWTTPHEMAARAFQGYVEDKIKEQGGKSPFLNFGPENVAIETPWGYKRPFPYGEERKAINKAFDKFVNELKTKKTDTGIALYSRSKTTQQNYENRIDELFKGAIPKQQGGAVVLDSSDMLGLLGYGKEKITLAEGKVLKSQEVHKMTPDLWKKIPEWLDNPLAVFESDTVEGRLVFIAPDKLVNDPILMIVDPNAKEGRATVNLLINAYDGNSKTIPTRRWVKQDKLLYIDNKKSLAISAASWLQLPTREQQNRPGSKVKILTEKSLVKYRNINNVNKSIFNDRKSGSTKEQVISWLPKRIQRKVGSVVEVVQSVDELPDSLFSSKSVVSSSVKSLADSRTTNITKSGSNFAMREALIKQANSFINRIPSVRLRRIKSMSNEVIKNDVLVEIKLLSDLHNAHSFTKEGFGSLNIPSKRAMYELMVGVADNLKILDSIVELIPVNMMNVFGVKKLTTDISGNDMSMLIDLLSRNTNNSVSSRINESFFSALMGTEVYSALINAALISNDVTTTRFTGDKYLVDTVVFPAFGVTEVGSSFRDSGSGETSVTGGTIDDRHNVTPSSDVSLGVEGADTLSSPSIISQLQGIQALYQKSSDTIYLVADSLNRENLKGVLFHELLHRAEANDKKLQKQLSILNKRLQVRFNLASKGKGSQVEIDAYNRVMDANTPLEDQQAEFRAYIVEAYNNKPDSLTGAIKRWIQDRIAAIRAALIRIGFLPKEITAADLNALAGYGLKSNVSPTNKESPVLASKAPKLSKGNNAWEGLKDSEVTEYLDNHLGKITSTAKAQSFGLLTLRQIADVTSKVLPEIKNTFIKNVHAMQTEKNKRLSDAGVIATKWADLPKEISFEMSDLMHDSTIAGVDGSKAYKPVIDIETADSKIKVIRQKMRDRSGEDKAKMLRDIDEIKMKVEFEKKRKLAYPGLKRRFTALTKKSHDAAKIYHESRDYHEKHFTDTLEALTDRIEQSKASPTVKKNLMAQLRAKFESLQAEAPYFPLARFGDFWVHTQDGDETYFNMFESESEQKNFIEKMQNQGVDILGDGKQLKNLHQIDGVSAEFITEVDNLISQLGDVPMVNDLRDNVYQLYLHSLPDVSARKHFIHRKKTKGFHHDQLRAFAKKALHDANNIAKLIYGHKLQATLDESKEVVDIASSKVKREAVNLDIDHIQEYFRLGLSMAEIKARMRSTEDEVEHGMLLKFRKWKENYSDDALEKLMSHKQNLLSLADNIKQDDKVFAVNSLNELRQSYADMMSPKLSPISQMLNSLGFAWYLGLTPAAAIVNVTQTPVVSLPMLAAKVGWGNASKHMGDVTKLFFSNLKGGKKNGLPWVNGLTLSDSLTGLEKEAFQEWIDSGLIDVTLAHDLAGLSDEGVLTNTFKHKLMNVLSFGFHHAERMNREITALASYRSAIEKGMTHNNAVQFAADIVWDSHFDYSSANRARFMRGNVARVITQFKQYSQNLTYLYGRTFQQAFSDGVTAEERAEARRALKGLLIMQMSAAGALGLPVVGVMMESAQVLKDIFGDDDEPEDIEGLFRQTLADIVSSITGSEEAGNKFSLIFSKGVVDGLTPYSVSGRLSASDLWIRSPNRELEGSDQAWQWAKTLLGPMSGLLLENPAIALSMAQDGHYERALEQVMPKSIKDAMKSIRYTTQGVENLRGDKLTDDYSIAEGIGQILGFSSSQIAEIYDQNSAVKRLETRLNKRRQSLLTAAALARMERDNQAYSNAMKEIREFNKKNPKQRITSANISQSIKTRRRRTGDTENGLYVSKRNNELKDRYRFAN